MKIKFNRMMMLSAPCIMCVQYRGGVQYRRGYLEYRGGVQYSEDIMSTVGVILSTVGDTQYCGGYSVLWGIS